MSVNAQLARGTKLFIAGTGGSAKNLSAGVAGFPTILTSNAHGLKNGDIVAIAAITGTMGTDATNGLNGKSFVVKNVTTNTFAIEADTVGLTYTSGGTATPNTWTQIKELKGISPSGASVSELDATDLDSTAMEYLMGLPDQGTLSFQINILESDPGQAACLALFLASGNANFKVESPAKTRTFNGGFLKWPTIPDSMVNGIQTGTAELRVSGAVTVA
jgi:hypothetical protein